MPIIQTTDPVEQPIALADARLQCQVDSDITDEDTLIDSYIEAATSFCEEFTSRPLITQEKQYIGGLNKCIELTPNLLSVESVIYIDVDGSPQTLDPAKYHIDTASIVGQIVPLEAWPAVKANHPQPITVNFTCGYGDAAAVPDGIKQCMRMLIGHWYRNREAVVVGVSAGSLDYAVDALLNPYRIARIG